MAQAQPIEEAIAALLEAATEPGSKNRLAVTELREQMRDYLAFQAAEEAELPSVAGQDHWNLTMADYDLDRNAMFVAWLFSGGQVRLCAGRGDAGRIKTYCESECPMQPDEAFAGLTERFSVPGTPVAFAQSDIEQWATSSERNESPSSPRPLPR